MTDIIQDEKDIDVLSLIRKSALLSLSCAIGCIPVHFAREILIFFDKIWPYNVTLFLSAAVYLLYYLYALSLPSLNVFSGIYIFRVKRLKAPRLGHGRTLPPLILANLIVWGLYFVSVAKFADLIIRAWGPQ